MAYEQFKQLDAVKHERTIKSLIGMSRAHFETLAVAFAVAYDAVQLYFTRPRFRFLKTVGTSVSSAIAFGF